MEPGGRETFFSLMPACKLVRGYASQHFLEPNKHVVELQSPLVYITDQNLTQIQQIVPYLEYVMLFNT
jgi:chaperonin GroEL (HSP60 family)